MIEIYSGRRGVIVYNRGLGCAFKLVMSKFYVGYFDGIRVINPEGLKYLYADELESVFDFWGVDILSFVWCSNVNSFSFSYLEGNEHIIEEVVKDEGYSREADEKRWFWMYLVNLFLIEKINKCRISYNGFHDNDMWNKKYIRYVHRLVTCYGGMGIDGESSIILRGYGKVMGWGEGGEEG